MSKEITTEPKESGVIRRPHLCQAALHLQDEGVRDGAEDVGSAVYVRLIDAETELLVVQYALKRLLHVVHHHDGDAAVQHGVDIPGRVPVSRDSQTELGAGKVLGVIPLVLGLARSDEDVVLLPPFLLMCQPVRIKVRTVEWHRAGATEWIPMLLGATLVASHSEPPRFK
jgi:hypothetical protein